MLSSYRASGKIKFIDCTIVKIGVDASWSEAVIPCRCDINSTLSGGEHKGGWIKNLFTDMVLGGRVGFKIEKCKLTKSVDLGGEEFSGFSSESILSTVITGDVVVGMRSISASEFVLVIDLGSAN